MRTLVFVMVAVSLLAIVPAADAAPPSGGACHVQEEYVRDASLEPSDDPTENPVKPGADRPIECYY